MCVRVCACVCYASLYAAWLIAAQGVCIALRRPCCEGTENDVRRQRCEGTENDVRRPCCGGSK